MCFGFEGTDSCSINKLWAKWLFALIWNWDSRRKQ